MTSCCWYPRLTQKTSYRTTVRVRPLESREAIFVHLHSCIRDSRHSSGLKYETRVTHRGCLYISLALAGTVYLDYHKRDKVRIKIHRSIQSSMIHLLQKSSMVIKLKCSHHSKKVGNSWSTVFFDPCKTLNMVAHTKDCTLVGMWLLKSVRRARAG